MRGEGAIKKKNYGNGWACKWPPSQIISPTCSISHSDSLYLAVCRDRGRGSCHSFIILVLWPDGRWGDWRATAADWVLHLCLWCAAARSVHSMMLATQLFLCRHFLEGMLLACSFEAPHFLAKSSPSRNILKISFPLLKPPMVWFVICWHCWELRTCHCHIWGGG